jgi:hypothetical protein
MEAATACVFLLLRFVSASAFASAALSRVRFMIYLPLPPPLPLHLLPARCYIQTTGGYDLLRTKNFCTNLLYKKRTFHLLVSC